ncbi:YceD family protein [Cytobacillus sp. Hm23]
MKWTIHQLYQLQNKDILIDETVDVSDIKHIEKSIRNISPVKVTGVADVSHAKVIFHLTITGSMVLPCSRTLVDVQFPFTIKTTETFLFKQSDFDDEDEVHNVEGDVVDILPIIKENILLEIPMQIYSESVHEDQVLQSGKDWSVITEEDVKNQIDPRLAGLAKYFDKNKEN